MEDISRELEREIAQSKPKPYKKDRKIRILMVDDLGQIKSGEYLKTLVKILSVISLVCFVAAGSFYLLYTGVSRDANAGKSRLSFAEQKVDELTREKELYMARLVILGEEPGMIKQTAEEKPPLVSKHPETTSFPPEPEDVSKINKSLAVEEQNKFVKTQLSAHDKPSKAPIKSEPSTTMKKTISIEKFAVTRDGANGDLLVRFDIRNMSNEKEDVTGRIFTLLQPDNNLEDQYLVVPKAPLKNGIPSEYEKGQYFSISRFKPVKFRIKNQAGPDFFKKASIFIFNNQGDLIFEKLIDITETK